MSAINTAPELQLPWESSLEEDRVFQKILRALVILLVIVSVLIPMLTVSELKQSGKADPSPQLSHILIEEQVLPKPVPVDPKPKVEPKVRPAPEKPLPVPESREPPKPVDKAQFALEQAKDSGVFAFQDDLEAMRDNLDLDSLQSSQATRSEADAATLERSLLTTADSSGSQGISTANLSRDTGGAALSARQTTRVNNTMAAGTSKDLDSASAQLGGRSDESIRREMDRNKGAIFAIYNRALRRDPLLEGKLVFEMSIESSGEVAAIRLLSSELDDEALTKKILSRISLIRFPSESVVTTVVNYSFDFLPYS
ncbi:MAG: AgmX/PglI C-terminal domain-containing protein [Halioglobus sp.]